jgi:hypothetical protein
MLTRTEMAQASWPASRRNVTPGLTSSRDHWRWRWFEADPAPSPCCVAWNPTADGRFTCKTPIARECAVSSDQKTPTDALGIPPKGTSLVEPRISQDPAEAGPTSPGRVEPSKDHGPETGGYDDHSPDRHPTNRKGGYGAG